MAMSALHVLAAFVRFAAAARACLETHLPMAFAPVPPGAYRDLKFARPSAASSFLQNCAGLLPWPPFSARADGANTSAAIMRRRQCLRFISRAPSGFGWGSPFSEVDPSTARI